VRLEDHSGLPMKKFLVPVLGVLLASAAAAFAQMEMPGSPAGINAALTKLFGNIKAFTAKSEVQVFGKDQKEKLSTPMGFAMLDGKMRVDIDVSRMRNKDIPAAAYASMKQLGMDHVVSVFRPDKGASYIIFPRMRSYLSMPMPKAELEAYKKNPNLKKTVLGKETLDGHACIKQKVIMTDDQGQEHEATVWNASDLRDFPVKIQTTDKDDTVILRYREIQMVRPDSRRFEVPAGFKAYDDMQSLMQGLIINAIKAGGAASRK
jgi:hypothetical protein